MFVVPIKCHGAIVPVLPSVFQKPRLPLDSESSAQVPIPYWSETRTCQFNSLPSAILNFQFISTIGTPVPYVLGIRPNQTCPDQLGSGLRI